MSEKIANTVRHFIIIMLVLGIWSMSIKHMELSMQKDSQIQKLQAQVDSIPKVCMEQFGQ